VKQKKKEFTYNYFMQADNLKKNVNLDLGSFCFPFFFWFHYVYMLYKSSILCNHDYMLGLVHVGGENIHYFSPWSWRTTAK